MNPTARRLLWLLAVGGTVAAVAWVDGGDDNTLVAASAQRSGAGAAAKGGATTALPALELGQLEVRKFDDMKADLFAAKSWYVPPPPPPPAKPRPPPLPFTYSGRMIAEGRSIVFLVQQGRNQPVKSGDLLDNTWRVDAIGPTTMTFTYLPLNESQTLALGAAP